MQKNGIKIHISLLNIFAIRKKYIIFAPHLQMKNNANAKTSAKVVKKNVFTK